MNYAQWKNMAELREELTKVDKNLTIKRSGIPLTYDDEHLYIDDKDHHTLVIGTTGSGKTQSVVLPQIKLSMYANESLVISDANGEIYKTIGTHLEKRGYKVYVINYDNTKKGNNWNPLTLPYKLYKKGNVDEAQGILEKIGYYLFKEMGTNTMDSFWTESATQCFIGIALYLFENVSEEEINFNSIYDIACIGEEKYEDKTYFNYILSQLDRTSPIYINLSGTLLAPTETRGGILSVFKQILRLIVSRQGLSSMLGTSDFALEEITNDKFAIFLVGGINAYTTRLNPMFIDELYSAVLLQDERKSRINIILDEFDSFCPLNNFSNLLNSSRSMNMKFTIVVKSLIDLERQYGKEDTEIIKYTMGCIIYLLANDNYTLEEICRLCGNKSVGTPLITPEELKLLQIFEAVVLMPRILPIKTKLMPDYKIPWELQKPNAEQPERNVKEYKVFDLKKI